MAGYLANLYIETNLLHGHAYSCAFGAGVDCTCGHDRDEDDTDPGWDEQTAFVIEGEKVLRMLLKELYHGPIEDDDIPF